MKKAVIINIKDKVKYLNIGNTRVIPVEGIVGIFDMDETTVSRSMRDFLRQCQKSEIIISVANSLPKSIIYYDDGIRENIYFSSFNSTVLYKRICGEEQKI